MAGFGRTLGQQPGGQGMLRRTEGGSGGEQAQAVSNPVRVGADLTGAEVGQGWCCWTKPDDAVDGVAARYVP